MMMYLFALTNAGFGKIIFAEIEARDTLLRRLREKAKI